MLFVSDTLWELCEKEDEIIIKGFYCEIFYCLTKRVCGSEKIEPIDQQELEQTLNFVKIKFNM